MIIVFQFIIGGYIVATIEVVVVIGGGVVVDWDRIVAICGWVVVVTGGTVVIGSKVADAAVGWFFEGGAFNFHGQLVTAKTKVMIQT